MMFGRNLAALALLLFATTSCKDNGQKSSDEAKTNVADLVSLSEKDVGEIERGLPEGAKKMAAQLATAGKDADQSKNTAGVRSALLKMRQQIPDLGVAKSTFFAFTDDKGIAIRNDLETDTMAGKNVVAAYPELAKALSGAPYIATNGVFPGAPNPAGPDKEWVAGVPVKRDDGVVSGLLVTGWTYRRFAFHLQESLKRDVTDHLLRQGDKGKLPVLYAFLFDTTAVYGGRGAPTVDEQALAALNLVEKTAQGPTSGTIVITDRTFGFAAARAPKLGADVGIVVLRSEI